MLRHFISNRSNSEIAVKEAPLSLLVPTYVLVIATIWFGLDASMITIASQTAAESLMNGGFGGEATIMGVEGRK